MSEKAAFLSKSLQTEIDSFNAKRKENKRKALLLKLSITALGGTTTVLLGLQGIEYESLLKNVGLIFSALVTLLSTWDTFFNHRALWTRYTATYTGLLGIESELEYLRQGGDGVLTESQVDGLYGCAQAILRDTNEWWQHERQEEKPLGGARRER